MGHSSFKLNNQSGFSLIGALITAAVISGLAIVMLRLQTIGLKTSNTTKQRLEQATFLQNVKEILADPTACFNTFSSANLSTITTFTEIRDQNNSVRFQTQNEISAGAGITLETVQLENFQTDANGDGQTGEADLVITTQKVGEHYGGATQSRRLRVRITTNSHPNNTTIQNCIVQGTAGDTFGPWILGSTLDNMPFLYTDDNPVAPRVGIGSGNVEPRAKIEITSDFTSPLAIIGDASTVASGTDSMAIGIAAEASGVSSIAFPNSKAQAQESIAMLSGEASGIRSFALGYLAFATQEFAIAIGNNSRSSGQGSIALSGSESSGFYSLSSGFNSLSSGASSVAMGNFSLASDEGAIALGNASNSSAKGAIALGNASLASGEGSFAAGDGATASGNFSTAIGKSLNTTDLMTEAKANYSLALGAGSSTSAAATGAVAIGTRNKSQAPNSFAIGTSSRSDAPLSFSIGNVAVTETSSTYSFAMGNNVKAAENSSNSFVIGSNSTSNAMNGVAIGHGLSIQSGHDGAMVLATTAQSSSGPNTFTANFSNGYKLYLNGFTGAPGMELVAGNNNWTAISSRKHKENFVEIKSRDVLKQIMNIEVSKWNYIGTPDIKNIGPIAEDFHKAFPMKGKNKKRLGIGDVSGVNMRAIQALIERTDALVKKNQQLEEQNQRLHLALCRLLPNEDFCL